MIHKRKIQIYLDRWPFEDVTLDFVLYLHYKQTYICSERNIAGFYITIGVRANGKIVSKISTYIKGRIHREKF